MVTLGLGNDANEITDGNGKKLEWVNKKNIVTSTIPTGSQKKFIDIIVCPDGYRDLAAQRYYNIIKTSADIALAQKEKEYEQLRTVQQKDYEKWQAYPLNL